MNKQHTIANTLLKKTLLLPVANRNLPLAAFRVRNERFFQF